MLNPTSIPEGLLTALDLVALERVSARSFKAVAALPEWFKRFVDASASGGTEIGVGAQSPFLANFLIDAEKFWTSAATGRIGSGLWTEVDDAGADQHFEAVACCAGERKLLIVNRLLESEYPQRQGMFQGARDALLRASASAREATRNRRRGSDARAVAQLVAPPGLDGDVLTRLPTRSVFEEHLSHRLNFVKRGQKQSLGVLLVAIDRFDRVAATLGPSGADLVLKLFAARLWACTGALDTVARFGRDEFAVLVTLTDAPHDAQRFVSAVQEILRPPFDCGPKRVTLTASLGVALSGDEDADAASLLGRAASALRKVKAEGGNACLYSGLGVEASAQSQLKLEADLRRAIERDEFLIHYQPRVDLKTQRIVGMEALLRWQAPGRGLVPPLEFLPFAERTGLIVPIGEWVLRAACKQMRTWRNEGLEELALSVNMSVRQLEHPGMVDSVRGILDEARLPASCLELELTESAVMKDIETCIPTLREFKNLGVGVSIDDFGTGYSSLAYLKRLPVDVLKIDRAFVQDVAQTATDAAIVAAIVTVAQQLKLTTVAEGVTSLEQCGVLGQLGCNEFQGYLFSRPLAPQDFAALVRKSRAA